MKSLKNPPKPSDYYFQAMYDSGMEQNVLWLTKKKFFDKNGHLDDQERDDAGLLPPDYYNMMEACFEFPDGYSINDVITQLTGLGFTEHQMVEE